ncbi:MAG: hypothetical protein U0169_15810 [Polyangiaceae bacterium]
MRGASQVVTVESGPSGAKWNPPVKVTCLVAHASTTKACSRSLPPGALANLDPNDDFQTGYRTDGLVIW